MNTVVDNAVCRCCSSEGAFKNIKGKYIWMGEEETYIDMLKDCYDIQIIIPEKLNHDLESGICELCITQLRNALNFRKQVLTTEEVFRKRFSDKIQLCESNCIKIEEPSDGLHDDDDGVVDALDFDINVSEVHEYEVPVKEEESEGEVSRSKRSKRTTRSSTIKIKRSKLDRAETSKCRTGGRKKRKKTKSTHTKIERVTKRVKEAMRETNVSEMKKQWHNLTTILKNSNATPFKDRNDAGYVCAYCFNTYPDAENLRHHTHETHNREKHTYKLGSGMSSFVVFLDIVNLKCVLCDAPFEDLSSLVNHLIVDHDKKYYIGTTDYFQPFKLTNEQQIGCCLCSESYHNMKLLMQHMNEHYRNFICTVCGAGFVNSFRRNRHETIHAKKKTSYTCRHCEQIFCSESKRKAHINVEHKGVAGDSVCQICKERFKNYYQKTRHMVVQHNAEGIKCEVCGKRFNLKSNLVLHMRSVHLKERPYECSVCSMGFFIKRHMVGHYMATHTNERKFKCEVCGKAYATQNSRRKHMKKNHGATRANDVMDLN